MMDKVRIIHPKLRQCESFPQAIEKIVVFMLRYIGDTLSITPVLDALKAALPNASIAVVVSYGTEPVLWNHPAIDEIISIDRSAPLMRYSRFLHMIRKRKFDLAIDLTNADRPAFLSFWSHAPIRMGYRGRSFLRNHLLYNVLIDPKTAPCHIVDHHLAMVEAMGFPVKCRTPQLYLTNEEIAAAAQLFRQRGISTTEPFVVMHPGARRWYKSWPAEYFSCLGDRVEKELRLPVVLVGGLSDVEMVEKIQKGMTAACVPLAGTLNLRELGCLLKMAALCIVNDSAPMHLAAAVGTPTIALFGLTDPLRWAPRGAQCRVLSRECPCRPYGHRRECQEGENHCMRKISVEEVFDEIKLLFTTLIR